jgi:hypothetical protein
MSALLVVFILSPPNFPANHTVRLSLPNGIMVLMVLMVLSAPDQGKPAAKPGRKANRSFLLSNGER